jgi:putative transposase
MAGAGYPTDLSDGQWALVEPLLPTPRAGGRPRTTDLRRVCDAILYLVKTGCQWRNLPHDFPPWETCYTYFAAWRRAGVVKLLQRGLVARVRRADGRKAAPSIAILDSQSVKSGKFASSERGYDGGKHTKGRKRHLAVDTLGLPLAVAVTSANTHDKVGGRQVIGSMAQWLKPHPRKIVADGGYSGAPFSSFVRNTLSATVEIAGNIAQRVKAFVPVARRWVVERTFAWLGDYRRLDKDQERLTCNSVAMIGWALASLMLRRLFPAGSGAWS